MAAVAPTRLPQGLERLVACGHVQKMSPHDGCSFGWLIYLNLLSLLLCRMHTRAHLVVIMTDKHMQRALGNE